MAATGYAAQGTIPTVTSGAGRRVAIVSSTNASPIVIHATAHGMLTGDSIEVEGHATNTAANGQWQATKVDADHLALNGSTGNGVGGATGYITDFQLQPAVMIPAPGDAASMVTLGPVLEGNANPAPFLYRRLGKWRLYNEYSLLAGAIVPPLYSSPWSVNAGFQGQSTAVALASSTLTFESASSTPSGPAPAFLEGDLLRFSTSFTAFGNNKAGPNHTMIQIGFGLVQSGTLFPSGGSVVADFSDPGSTFTTHAAPVSVCGYYHIAAAGGLTLPTTALSFCIWAVVDYTSAVAFDLDLIGPWSGSFEQLRAN
jgi:hypothetical protein